MREARHDGSPQRFTTSRSEIALYGLRVLCAMYASTASGNSTPECASPHKWALRLPIGYLWKGTSQVLYEPWNEPVNRPQTIRQDILAGRR